MTKVHCDRSFELSNELRLLCWHGYPFKLLPSEFYPKNLVALDMSYSRLKHLWTRSMSFRKLKFIKLRYCTNLQKTQNCTKIPNLEELTLEGCLKLDEVHPSIGTLKNLVVLNLKNCKNVKSFSDRIELESLKHLILSGCSKLDLFPEDLGNMKALLELRVDGTGIKHLPLSVSSITNLQVLSLGCWHDEIQFRSWSSIFWPQKMQHTTAVVLPSFAWLHSLRKLDVSYCNLSEENLHRIGCLSSLEILNLSGNDFTRIPPRFNKFSRLELLAHVGCKRLQALPQIPLNITLTDAYTQLSSKKTRSPSTLNKSHYLIFNFGSKSKKGKTPSLENLASTLPPQGRVCYNRRIHFLSEGSRIPGWFGNQSTGHEVKVLLPPDWCLRKLVGIAFCVVFSPVNRSHSVTNHVGVSYQVRNFDGVETKQARGFACFQKRRIESDHRLLGYDRNILESEWNNVHKSITVVFELHGGHCKMRSCGARLVFAEDERLLAAPPAEDCDVSNPNSGMKSAATDDEFCHLRKLGVM